MSLPSIVKSDATDMAACEVSDAGLWGRRLLRFPALSSTNTWAAEHIDELGHGDVVWALTQTAGRGRLDRVWLAPTGTSLTVSVVIEDIALTPLAANLGQLAACAVLDTLSEKHIPGALKWPNDVMARDCKVAGLLTEQAPRSGAFILGIGLNVNTTAVELAKAGLDRPVTSMRDLAGHEFDLAETLQVLLRNLARGIDEARAHGLVYLWETWKQHDWLSGRQVSVMGHGRQIQGTYLGVDAEGRLRIRNGVGAEEVLWTGDVSVQAGTGIHH